tara:strand:- start:8728 stop:9624 length:897 start_codon:yes stop_codon:yes gene_type:complete
MSAGGFGAALSALHGGGFVKRDNWGDEYLFFASPTTIAASHIKDDRLLRALLLMQREEITDGGNIRLFRETTGEVINGWVPSQEDMVAHNWTAYTHEGMMEARMTRELNSPAPLTPEELLDLLSAHLTQRGIPWEMSDTGGPTFIDVGAPFEFAAIAVEKSDIDPGGAFYYTVTPEMAQRWLSRAPSSPHDPRYLRRVGSGHLIEELTEMGKLLGHKQISDRTFHRTIITLEVVSEDRISDDEGVESILGRANVCLAPRYERVEINASAAVGALKNLGAEPGLFGLTVDGKDIEDVGT